MQRGSLKALLTVLAVAGYQNRDKIADILKRVAERPGTAPPSGAPQGQGGQAGQAGQAGQSNQTGQAGSARTGGFGSGGGFGGSQGTASSTGYGGLDDIVDKLRTGGLGSILGGAGGGGIGAILNGGLSDLLDQFRQAGQQKKADSWVNTGANDPIEDRELGDALGPDILRDVASRTGLSEEEVLRRLSKNLPDAVDGLTPDGKVPPATSI